MMRRLCRLLLVWGVVGAAGAGGVGAAEPGRGPVGLTEADRTWVRSNPTVRVGFDPDFKPFSFRGADGTLQGIDADFLAWLGEATGLRFEPATAATWTEVYAAGVRRETDVLVSTADVPERRGAFLFTQPYLKVPVTIIARDDGPFALTHSDLRTMRVAAPRDYAATLAFARTYPGVATVDCTTIEEALGLVSRGEADAAVTNLTNASFVIKTAGLTNLKIAGVLPEHFELRLAVRADRPELHALLDRAVAMIPPERMATILDRWVKVDYAAVIRWDVVRRWAIVSALFVATVVALVVWRNRCLEEELAKRRVLQQELEATNGRLNQVNGELTQRHEEISELMRVAAHDLRGPLTAITLRTELLRSRLPAAADADAIDGAAQQMKQLVDDLLDVHALEQGKRVLHDTPTDFAAAVRAAAEGMAPQATRKRIAVDTGGVEPMPPVRADPGALRQVIDNLLSNALKFSPSGARVSLATAEWNAFARLEVRDGGPGVPAAERERIFTKYGRGTAQPTGGEKSTGLGLAIVRDLVAAMNGRVWCENGAGGGAVFVVVLPKAEGTAGTTGAAANAAG
jgi:two-component system sensor histidine kinase EvgS